MIRSLPGTLLAMFLFALLPLVAGAQSPSAPVEGRDYVVIPGGQPWQPLKGKIEVVEIFAYGCSHCADLQPKLEAWKRKQAGDVRVRLVPAAFDLRDPYARACFAAGQLGVLDKTHGDLFQAIHVVQSVPMHNASLDELAAFYGQHGVDIAKFKAAMASPAVDAQTQHAREFIMGSGLLGTPTLVVNGQYRIQSPTHAGALRIADQLIAMARTTAKAR